MDRQTQRFVEDYKKTVDTEFKLFNAEFQQFAADGEKLEPKASARLSDDIKELQGIFKAQKSNLLSHELTPEQAKEVLRQKPQEGQVHDVNAIDGSDCFRFFNRGLRNNPEVALEAVKQNPDAAKHLPEGLKERMQGPNPEASLQALCYANKLYGQLGAKTQSQSLSMSR